MELTKILMKSLERNSLQNKKFLLAISGGVDSMVLLHLFHSQKLDLSVAHCNFQLRGEASDLDEQLVREVSNQYQIPFYSIRFDVKAYQESGNYSVEMACRNLRYNWFSELQQKHNLEILVTAHHLNDQLETFFINLSRGSGIKGLSVMNELQSTIFRPFLEVSRETILAYAKQNNIDWREDESNASNIYIRNKIRNEVSPLLLNLHPKFLENFNQSIQFLKNENKVLTDFISIKKQELLINQGSVVKVKLDELQKLEPLETYLHYLFDEYDFHLDQLKQIITSNIGSEVETKKYRILKDRKFLLIKAKTEKLEDEIVFNLSENAYHCVNFVFQKSTNHSLYWDESLDLDKIIFPLTLRKKKEGDFFYPLGMNQKKKVSKFLKDEKLSNFDKENCWILVDNEDRILWISNLRIDERFKITDKTINFLNIKLC